MEAQQQQQWGDRATTSCVWACVCERLSVSVGPSKEKQPEHSPPPLYRKKLNKPTTASKHNEHTPPVRSPCCFDPNPRSSMLSRSISSIAISLSLSLPLWWNLPLSV